MTRSNNTTHKHELKHGTNEVLTFDRQGSIRWDLYISKDGGEFEESRSANGLKDFSAPVTTYDRESENFRPYTANCPACFLGHSHTIEYHEAHKVI